MRPKGLRHYDAAELDAYAEHVLKYGINDPRNNSNTEQLWQWINKHRQLLNHQRNQKLREKRLSDWRIEEARRFGEREAAGEDV